MCVYGWFYGPISRSALCVHDVIGCVYRILRMDALLPRFVCFEVFHDLCCIMMCLIYTSSRICNLVRYIPVIYGSAVIIPRFFFFSCLHFFFFFCLPTRIKYVVCCFISFCR